MRDTVWVGVGGGVMVSVSESLSEIESILNVSFLEIDNVTELEVERLCSFVAVHAVSDTVTESDVVDSSVTENESVPDTGVEMDQVEVHSRLLENEFNVPVTSSDTVFEGLDDTVGSPDAVAEASRVTVSRVTEKLVESDTVTDRECVEEISSLIVSLTVSVVLSDAGVDTEGVTEGIDDAD